MDGFMCRLCVNLTYRQTKAVLVIYPYFTASQIYIKQNIQASHWPEFNKLAVWCVAVCAFFGSFRIGELLSKKKNTFDATSTLLTKDCI
jgi:hypothetical protein